MKKFTLTLALAGVAGLIAGCGGGSADESGTTPEKPADDSALTAPIKKAEDVAGDLANKADETNAAMTEERTVMLNIAGMS